MKSLSKELLDRAILAMVAAIEIYNKPGIPYRNESFTILAINAWELLLKAKWLQLHGHRKQSLYVYENRPTKTGQRSQKAYIKRTRSGSPFTHDIGYLSNHLVNRHVLSPLASQNIRVMLEFRDSATHFFNDSPTFHSRLYEIGAACVKNFANAVDDWFQREVTEFSLHLMPLTFLSLPSNMKSSLFNAEERNFIAFVDSVDEHGSDPESPYSVTIGVEFKFAKSKSVDALPFQKSDDPSALQVNLTEEDIRENYPWDYATITKKCKQRYEDFKVNQRYHCIRKSLENDGRFGHLRVLDPGNSKSSSKRLFNPNILSELDKHYTKKDSR